MATRAEQFRYDTERSGPKKPKASGRSSARTGGDAGKPHNVSVRAAKKATYALEAPSGGRPSRKSTRKSANRQKTDVQTRNKRKTAEVRPESRPRRPVH